MVIKLGLISDPHATTLPVKEAMTIFKKQGVNKILCAGDIAGYGDELDQTVAILNEYRCECIQGNHESWWLKKHEKQNQTLVYQFLNELPTRREYHFAGYTLLMVHASPPDSQLEGIKLRDFNGTILESEREYWQRRLLSCEFDILVVGHTHQVFAEKIANAFVINPGSTLFNHSCAIITLPGCRVEWFPLSDQTIVKAWNWGMIAERP